MFAVVNQFEEQPAEGHAHPSSTVTKVARVSAKPVPEEVTLVVYGWTSVEPGTLSWVFPSLPAAVSAAHAMRNAIRWAIVRGRRSDASGAVDIDAARRCGAIIFEQRG